MFYNIVLASVMYSLKKIILRDLLQKKKIFEILGVLGIVYDFHHQPLSSHRSLY